MSNIKEDKFFLSFSAIESFTSCQRKYYYNYIAKLPKIHRPWLTFGNFNHLVLEKFHNYILFHKKRSRHYDKKALMKRAFFSAIRKSYRLVNLGQQVALTEAQIAESKTLLNRYFQRIDRDEPNTIYNEKYFELELGEGIWIRGYMDRVDEIGPKHYKITDYKTSKAAFSVNKNDQLAIYAIGLRKVLNAEDVEIFKQLDFLKVDKRMPASADGERHDPSNDKALLEKLLKRGKVRKAKIETDKQVSDWQWTENSFCWCCDFQDECLRSRGKQSQIGEFEFA